MCIRRRNQQGYLRSRIWPNILIGRFSPVRATDWGRAFVTLRPRIKNFLVHMDWVLVIRPESIPGLILESMRASFFLEISLWVSVGRGVVQPGFTWFLSFDQLTHSLIMIITSLSRSSPPASSCSHWCRVEDSWLLRDPNLLLIKFQRNWENFNLADICLKYMREISNNLRLNLF